MGKRVRYTKAEGGKLLRQLMFTTKAHNTKFLGVGWNCSKLEKKNAPNVEGFWAWFHNDMFDGDVSFAKNRKSGVIHEAMFDYEMVEGIDKDVFFDWLDNIDFALNGSHSQEQKVLIEQNHGILNVLRRDEQFMALKLMA
jgi:hypothetical protein